LTPLAGIEKLLGLLLVRPISGEAWYRLLRGTIDVDPRASPCWSTPVAKRDRWVDVPEKPRLRRLTETYARRWPAVEVATELNRQNRR
jgi:hypothetical protein